MNFGITDESTFEESRVKRGRMDEEIMAASSTFPFALTDEENDTYLQTQLDKNRHNKSRGNGDQDEREETEINENLHPVQSLQSLQPLFDPNWLPYDERLFKIMPTLKIPIRRFSHHTHIMTMMLQILLIHHQLPHNPTTKIPVVVVGMMTLTHVAPLNVCAKFFFLDLTGPSS